MCDQDHLADMGRRAKPAGMSRREFAATGAAATMLALAPLDGAEGQPLRLEETNVRFDAPDGRMDGFLVHLAGSKHPAVIVWPDIAGSRDAFTSMGRRLARAGYTVLILNPYYRDAEAPQFDDFDAFRSGEISRLVVSKVANFSIDLPEASVAIQVSGSFGSRQEEAQRLGRVMRPKSDGRTAHFYAVVARDTVDLDFAAHRQRFLAEQGYAYRIVDAEDLGVVQ